MKKVVVLAAALVLVAAGITTAGDYHYKGTLNCNDCHVMHGSQLHNYLPDTTGNPLTIGGAAPYGRLLRNEVNALCLSCHDGQNFAPDVLEVNGGHAPTLGREAGALNTTASVAPYATNNGHTLYSKATAPGGTWSNSTTGLSCSDCHMVHGSSSSLTRLVNSNSYRNLRGPSGQPDPRLGISYAVGTNNTNMDVFERSAAPGGDHYDIGNVDFNEPATDSSYYGQFCKICHTNFHGNEADANMNDGSDWVRHPTAQADLGSSILTQFQNHLYRPKVMSPVDGGWGVQGTAIPGTPAGLTPSCFTCHKAHGNQRAFGLIYPDSTGTVAIDEQGAGSKYRDLCKQCHSQG